MKRWVAAAALYLACCGACCGGSAFAQDKATIADLDKQFAAAFNRGDGAAIASLYAPDAILMPPSSSILRGRTEIAAYWRDAARNFADAHIAMLDLRPIGIGLGREIGTFTATAKSQPPEIRSVKYLVLWRRIGHDWKIVTDIWNANP